MKIEIARIDDRMAPSGKAILRSLQNDSLPIVDLVVRESFQNSLDATLPNSEQTNIDVSIGKIATNKIAHHFDSIDTRLKQLFPRESTMVAIRDSNTSGLTGKFNTDDKDELNNSNIYKLIYGLNMNQDKVDAGGSWGLGKTSFFRMGSGIVIYYSRVKHNNKYEERLAACLIEDSDKSDAIMPNNDRGIAWWGEKNSTDIYDKTLPITDPQFISEFTKSLGIKQYSENETGTTIIVPFIKDSKVTMEDTSKNDFPWETDIEESVIQAIQRWYFPRIYNRHYNRFTNNSILAPSVNGRMIKPENFSNTFDWFQSLYSIATQLGSTEESKTHGRIQAKTIHLATTGMSNRKIPIGYLAYVQLSLDDLKAYKNSGFISPISYIGNATFKDGSPYGANILAYMRKPGMVVEYVVNDNEWMKGLSLEENSYVFAVFVPNSDGNLHKKYLNYYSTLESYLRDTENADHATWIDKIIDSGRVTIVNRIKRSVAKELSADLNNTEAKASKRTSALSRHFGNMFLPMSNFGKSATIQQKPQRKKKKDTLAPNSLINVTDSGFVSENLRSVSFNATLQADTKSTLFFTVLTTDKAYNQESWNKTFEGSLPFPFIINKVKLTKIANKKVNHVTDTSHKKSASFEIPNPNKEKLVIAGTIEIEIHDLSMAPSLSMNTEHIKKEGDD